MWLEVYLVSFSLAWKELDLEFGKCLPGSKIHRMNFLFVGWSSSSVYYLETSIDLFFQLEAGLMERLGIISLIKSSAGGSWSCSVFNIWEKCEVQCLRSSWFLRRCEEFQKKKRRRTIAFTQVNIVLPNRHGNMLHIFYFAYAKLYICKPYFHIPWALASKHSYQFWGAFYYWLSMLFKPR